MLGLSLTLPWSGCEYIHQKEQLMRSVESDKLLHQAQHLAKIIEPGLVQDFAKIHSNTNSNKLYLYMLPDKIQLDGYHDDWGIEMNSSMEFKNQLTTTQPPDQNLTFIAGHNNHYLYLFFQVSDDDTIYSSLLPTDTPADHIELEITNHPFSGRHFLQVTAPGKFQTFSKKQDERDNAKWINMTAIQAYWQDTSTGYNVELRLPKPTRDTRLGFSVYDYDRDNNNQIRVMGQFGNQHMEQVSTAALIWRLPSMQRLLEQSEITASRIYILNPDGWILASKYNTLPPSKAPQNISHLNQTLSDILNQIYMFVSNLRDPPAPSITSNTGRISGQTIIEATKNITATSWYKKPGSNQAIISVTYPIKHSPTALAIIVIEQSSSVFLSLQNPDFVRNIAYSLFMIIALSLLMFIYTWKLARRLLSGHQYPKKSGD